MCPSHQHLFLEMVLSTLSHVSQLVHRLTQPCPPGSHSQRKPCEGWHLVCQDAQGQRKFWWRQASGLGPAQMEVALLGQCTGFCNPHSLCRPCGGWYLGQLGHTQPTEALAGLGSRHKTCMVRRGLGRRGLRPRTHAAMGSLVGAQLRPRTHVTKRGLGRECRWVQAQDPCIQRWLQEVRVQTWNLSRITEA